jgi:16S rRNA (guanine527-N7)-methyltransferase
MTQRAPEQAEKLFGDRLDLAVRYAELLAGPGVERGMLGPREVDRLWGRHILNCGVAAELVPQQATLCDVGSGGGLPGIPLALARPDLRVTLLEPLLRRTTFLAEVLSELDLPNVTVLRGRAEEMIGSVVSDVVTARAVAPLGRLAGWGLPLLRPGGEMLAFKGESAERELQETEEELRRLGAVGWTVRQVGAGLVDPPSTVVRVWVGEEPGGAAARGRRNRSARRARGQRTARHR